jgi:hypothetical protein
MDLAEKVPQMTDDALQTLATNARRLAEGGSAPQQAAAQALLPVIDAELASRRVAKLTKMRADAATARTMKKASGTAAPAKKKSRAASQTP